MAQLTNLTADQVGNIAAAVIASHGLNAWLRVVWDGGVLVVPDDLEAAVAAADADAPPLADYVAAIEQHIDQTARSKAYAGAIVLASYVNSTVPAWAAEGAAFVAWRDAVWTYAYVQMAAVAAAERARPSVSGLVAELPVIDWPA